MSRVAGHARRRGAQYKPSTHDTPQPPQAVECADCNMYRNGKRCYKHKHLPPKQPHQHVSPAPKPSKPKQATPSVQKGCTPLLDQWERLDDGRYKGKVYGRKGFHEGQEITTGAIASKGDNEVTTKSGSKYRLGKPKHGDENNAGNGGGQVASVPKGEKRASASGAKAPVLAQRDVNGGNKNSEKGPRHQKCVRVSSSSSSSSTPSAKDVATPASTPTATPQRGSGMSSHSIPSASESDDAGYGVYVGDCVRVKKRVDGAKRGNGKTSDLGTVMYVGTPSFGGGRVMVGIRMDERLSGGGGNDGKENGLRLFRCDHGHGCFVAMKDVELAKHSAKAAKNKEEDEPFDLDAELGKLVGLEGVKSQITSLRNRLEVAQRRAAFGVLDKRSLHSMFIGSKGVDFKGVAEVLARMFHSLDVLTRSKVVELGRKDLVGGNTEKTTEMTKASLKKCNGCVVLLTDPSTMTDKSDHYGNLALSLVVRHFDELASNDQPKAVLVIATQRATIPALSVVVPGLQALDMMELEFSDYSTDEMVTLLRNEVAMRGFELSESINSEWLIDLTRKRMQRCQADRAGKLLVEKIVEEAVVRQTDRVHASGTRSKGSLLALEDGDFTTDDSANANNEDVLNTVLSRLNDVIGLADVKAHVKGLVAQIQLSEKRKRAGLPCSKIGATMHMVFSGNPGTGKTTVARVVSECLCALGILRRGHLVETDRAGLVAPFVGQTALKTKEVVESALGGMLFVDEAYSLVKDDKDSFGREALDTLIKLVEDHRDDLVVVLAGYPVEMDELMMHNPGVRSRFPTVITFADYSEPELMQIAEQMLSKHQLSLTNEAQAALQGSLKTMATSKDNQNGNARAVRNILEKAMRRQAVRLADNKATLKPHQMSLLTEKDME